MWECCNCIQINNDEANSCEACGHNQCNICNSIDIPKGFTQDEQIYYFYLIKFFQNDKKLDPIEIQKLNDIAREYTLSEKKIKKIFEKEGLPIPKGIYLKSVKESKITLPSRIKSEKIRLPSKVNDEKVYHPSEIITEKVKKKNKLKLVLIFLLVIICGSLAFYFFYKPSNFVRTFSGFSENIKDLNFSPDGKILIGCSGKEIIVFDVEKGTTLSKNNISASLCDISNNGLYAITNDNNKVYDIWRTQVIKTLPLDISKKVKFSSDGKYLLIIYEKIINGRTTTYAKFYNFSNGKLVLFRSFDGTFIAISSNGNLILTYNEDKILVWNTYSRQIRRNIFGDNFYKVFGKDIIDKKNYVLGIKSICNDGKYIIHSYNRTGTVINLINGEKKVLNRYLVKQFNTILRSADFSSNGMFVATGEGRKIHLWNLY